MLAHTTSADAGWFLDHAYLIAIVPAVAFWLIIFFGKKMKDIKLGPVTLPGGGSLIGIASMLASLVLSAGLAYQWIQYINDHDESFAAPIRSSWVWWQSGGVEIGFGQHIDGLSVMGLLLVSFISTLVQIYSLEYLRGDRRYTHYFAAITLFSAGMLVMVLSENMIQFILGWEIMGLCSLMLIGHWWEDEANARASVKAFFTVRVGDVGLLVGVAIVGLSTQQWINANGLNEEYSGFSIEAISRWALSGDNTYTVALTAGAVALFIAAIGKSGQFPLHTWLPDAMAGPTPVSSLLHSSTMVVAGVYLVARLYPVFFEGLMVLDSRVNLIAVIGGITVIIAALLAFVQVDIKRVLAYSTVSQLGYMMLGLGVGGWTAAVFHIWTHAFFKCGLFLCAGSVAHSGSHHSFDMKADMGGLRKKMPVTFVCWLVCSAALAGVPLFAGFFSKDEIIDVAGSNGYWAFMLVGLTGAFMTAAYMTRATYLTFFGEPRGAAAGHSAHAMDTHDAHEVDSHDDHGAAHEPHESNWLIKGPLIILSTLAIVAGYLNAPAFQVHLFEEWVEPKATAVALAAAEGHEEEAAPAGETPEGTATEGEGHEGTPAAEGEGHEEGEEHATPGYPGGQVDEGHLTGECGTPDYVPPEGTACYAPGIVHHEFKWSKAIPSILLVLFGILISAFVSIALYTKRSGRLFGLTQRSKLARGGYSFLWNKYYLDHLYERVIVHAIAHPIAKAMYWINQNVIDGVVNGAGKAGKKVGEATYKYVDQGVVDRIVDGSGAAASETGKALRHTQSGKVSQYGALLFGAAAVGALILVLVNT